MPAPITAMAMNPTRHSKGSVSVYSASPPHTPPSTLLVVLRRRWGRADPGAVAGAGCQDAWSDPGGSPEDEGPDVGEFGSGVAVMDEGCRFGGLVYMEEGPR